MASTGRHISNSKRDPSPSVDCTLISPPIKLTRRRAIANPRPVPSNRRLDAPSTCSKTLNIPSSFSSGIPIPVSTISNFKDAMSSSSIPVTCIATWPSSVNLTAFPARLLMTCRSRSESPIKRAGRSGWKLVTISTPLACARVANIAPISSNTSLRSKATGSICNLPASTLEKSRMSLINVNRAIEELEIVDA